MKKNISIGIGLLFIVLFYFWGMWNFYFVQDEWNGFGLVIALLQKPIWSWFDMVTSLHFIPLTSLGWLTMYKIYGFHASYYAITSILLHTLASFLVYKLAKNLSKNNYIGILTAVLFATNSKAHAAVTYLGVFSNTIPFFILIVTFFMYLNKVSKKKILIKKDAVVLLTVFFATVLFREDGVILIPLLAVFLYLYNKPTLNRKNITFFVIFYCGSLSYLVYRIYLQLKNPSADAISGSSFFQTFFYNAIALPFKLIVQNIFDGYYTIQLYIIPYLNNFNLVKSSSVASGMVYDIAILTIFLIITVIFLLVVWKIKDKLFWKNILFSLAIVLFNALMLATIGRHIERVEERYLYLSGFAVMFIISIISINILNLKSKSYFNNIKKATVIIVIFGVFLAPSYFRIQDEIRSFTKVGKVREQIIENIVKLHPTIMNKAIFYVECKKVCFRNSEFGLVNNLVLPFSSGPGWIILLQYAKDNEKDYYKFFTYHGKKEFIWDWKVGKFNKVKVHEFLWDMGAQGYTEKGKYGFGYFIDKALLKEAIIKNHLNKSAVIGLEYDETDFSIKDISTKVQSEL